MEGERPMNTIHVAQTHGALVARAVRWLKGTIGCKEILLLISALRRLQ